MGDARAIVAAGLVGSGITGLVSWGLMQRQAVHARRDRRRSWWTDYHDHFAAALLR